MIWPMLIAAGTAVAVLLFDLIVPRWFVPFTVAALGCLATAGAAAYVRSGQLSVITFVYDHTARLTAILFGLLTFLAVLLLMVGSSRVDLQACKLEYSIVSPK